MGYWDEVKKKWNAMEDGDFKEVVNFNPGKNSTGGNTGSGGLDHSEWEKIHQKFRQHYGRDPYSLQELKDWWANL